MNPSLEKSYLVRVFYTLGTAYSQSFFVKSATFGWIIVGLIALFDTTQALWGIAMSTLALVLQERSFIPRFIREFGIIPLNGLFLGVASAHFFERSPITFVWVSTFAACLPLLCTATYAFLQRWRLSPLIFPSLLSLSILLQLPNLHRSATLSLQNASHSSLDVHTVVFESIGRWMHHPNVFLGGVLWLALLLFRPRNAIALLLGLSFSAIILVAFFLYGAIPFEWSLSELALSGGVVALGASTLPEKPRLIRVLTSIFVTIIAGVIVSPLLTKWELPLLSYPYILGFWLLQLSLQSRVRIVKQRSVTPFSHRLREQSQ